MEFWKLVAPPPWLSDLPFQVGQLINGAEVVGAKVVQGETLHGISKSFKKKKQVLRQAFLR